MSAKKGKHAKKPVKAWAMNAWALIDRDTGEVGGVYFARASARILKADNERVARVEIREVGR